MIYSAYTSCGVGEDSWESHGLQGDQTRKSVLNIHWKNWCWSWSFNTLATWCEEPNITNYKEMSPLERRLNIELTSRRRRKSGLRSDSVRAKVKSLAFFTAVSIFNSINNPVQDNEDWLVVHLCSWVIVTSRRIKKSCVKFLNSRHSRAVLTHVVAISLIQSLSAWNVKVRCAVNVKHTHDFEDFSKNVMLFN